MESSLRERGFGLGEEQHCQRRGIDKDRALGCMSVAAAFGACGQQRDAVGCGENEYAP